MVLGFSAITKALVDEQLEFSSFPENDKQKKAWVQRYVQPASIDLEIGDYFYVMEAVVPMSGRQIQFHERKYDAVKTTNDAMEYFVRHQFDEYGEDGAVLSPGQTILVPTSDRVRLGDKIAGQVATRSTARRWGLDVCGSAGWVDPGYDNFITLELMNTSPKPIYIRPGVAYAQLILFAVEGAGEGYNGHYNSGSFSLLPKAL